MCVDGGLTVNDFLMQLQSDVLQKNISISQVKDATSLGAGAFLSKFKLLLLVFTKGFTLIWIKSKVWRNLENNFILMKI